VWGARRDGENWTGNFVINSLSLTGFDQSVTRRGYTGHEMLDEHKGLIHMNGRIYDAILARFIQADPLVDGAGNTQGYNRYSYVHNNPLNATDPSGFSSWTKFRDGVLKPVIQGVVSFYCPVCGAMLAATTTAYYGGSLSQIATAAFSSYIMSTAGASIGGSASGFGFNMATLGYATLGGALSAAQGGKFGHGFVSAGVGSVAGAQLGPVFNANGFSFPGLIASAVIGGTVSEISGGKFANGAQSAAFSYVVTWGARKIEAGGETHSSSNGRVLVDEEGTPEDRQKTFKEVRDSKEYKDHEDIEFVDKYMGVEKQEGQADKSVPLSTREEYVKWERTKVDGVSKGTINGIYDPNTGKITLYRTSVIPFKGELYTSGGTYSGYRTGLERGYITMGHEIAHRYGIDMGIGNVAPHLEGNFYGILRCQSAGHCAGF